MQITDQLLKAAKHGDRKSQSLLYRQCYPILMSTVTRYKRLDTEAVGLMNEAFLKILKNLDRYEPTHSFGSWIRRIQINTIIDDFRKHKRYHEHEQSSEFSQAADTDFFKVSSNWNEGEQNLNVEEIEAAIRELPEVKRQIFNLFVIDGYSHDEISKMLGIPEGTSKWHLNEARKILQKTLRRANLAV